MGDGQGSWWARLRSRRGERGRVVAMGKGDALQLHTRRMYSTNVLNRIFQGFRAAFRGFDVTVFRTPWLINPFPSTPPRIALPTAACRGPVPAPLKARLPNDMLPLPPGDPEALHNLGRSPLILTTGNRPEGANPRFQAALPKRSLRSRNVAVSTLVSREQSTHREGVMGTRRKPCQAS